MSVFEDRIDQFLSNYDFHSNCIDFRIRSSKALEKWKNVQAFQLNQLSNGKFYFAPDRREILLLKYDIWSRWLYEVENLCLELAGDNKKNLSTEKDIGLIIDLCEKAADTYKDIMSNANSQYFDQTFLKLWIAQHEYAYQYLITVFKKLIGLPFVDVFAAIVDYLTIIMQYTLIEIHELDSLFIQFDESCNDCVKAVLAGKKVDKPQLPFISIDNTTLIVFEETGICLAAMRLKTYLDYFNFNKIYIKNYTDEQIPSDLLVRIESTGVEIDFKKSLSC